MAIPETQLDTWSHQGAVTQSKDTYATVKRALESERASYTCRDFEVFLQGSYGNDTNVYAESDVDVVIRLDATFYYCLDDLNPVEQAAFQRAHPGGATYTHAQFKAHVVAALETAFPRAVTPGNKAVKIAAAGNRRNADVVAAAQYRRYYTFPSASGATYAEGICFFLTDGTQIVNYPRQHSANCTAKHQATNEWFKPTVRILKNIRRAMVDAGLIVLEFRRDLVGKRVDRSQQVRLRQRAVRPLWKLAGDMAERQLRSVHERLRWLLEGLVVTGRPLSANSRHQLVSLQGDGQAPAARKIAAEWAADSALAAVGAELAQRFA